MFGQKLHHQMLSAQGSLVTTNEGVKVSQTIAQQVVIGTATSGNTILSQGFQHSAISKKTTIASEALTTMVYPNPISDFINFQFSSPVQGKIGFSIFDIHGRLLFYQEKEAIENLLTISNLALADAEYYIKLEAKNYLYSTKIIKKS